MRTLKEIFGFAKKATAPLPPKPQPPDWWHTWELLRLAYPVGREFSHLGRRMIVMCHTSETRLSCIDIHLAPMISAEYCNEAGEIQTYWFGVSQAPAFLPPPK
jgi:hypothetical protein